MPALTTVSMWEPTMTGRGSAAPAQMPKTLPIRSTAISSPASFIQPTSRSRPALSASVAATRARRPCSSWPIRPNS
ncbi:hypothetical protein [Azospirillum sp. INR13]|uniref:hypothetical protein n=1 Tax=Azospirillum sp. INR13 TaxID=2596919 RepID=UPI00210409F3|nr:hypothetical protein [Azospirillum sp. INR13]